MLEVPPVETAELCLRNVQRMFDLVCGGNLRSECFDNLSSERHRFYTFFIFTLYTNTHDVTNLLHTIISSICKF